VAACDRAVAPDPVWETPHLLQASPTRQICSATVSARPSVLCRPTLHNVYALAPRAGNGCAGLPSPTGRARPSEKIQDDPVAVVGSFGPAP